jgi:nitroreductase
MQDDFIPYALPEKRDEELLRSAASFNAFLNGRRTVRTFSDRPVSSKVIENLIMTASSAPSGANKQPWHFCAVGDPVIKRAIREAAEQEEYQSYTKRMSAEWKKDLEKLNTNWEKPFLEKAPWLIVVFMQNYELVDGEKRLNYYVKESVGLATGIFLTAAYHAGLATLTYTPSPMAFLSRILKRPVNEKPYMVIPVGFPAKDTKVPNINRKSSKEVISFYT